MATIRKTSSWFLRNPSVESLFVNLKLQQFSKGQGELYRCYYVDSEFYSKCVGNYIMYLFIKERHQLTIKLTLMVRR